MLKDTIALTIASGQVGIRIRTDEQEDAIAAVAAACQAKGWLLRLWDRHRGLIARDEDPVHDALEAKRKARESAALKLPPGFAPPAQASAQVDMPTAYEVLATLAEQGPIAGPAGSSDVINCVVVMRNFDLVFNPNAPDYSELVAMTQQIVCDNAASGYKFLIGLTPPDATLPPHLEPAFGVIDHDLPDEAELLDIVKDIADTNSVVLTGQECADFAKAALGLTRLQATSAVAESIVAHHGGAKGNKKTFGVVGPKAVWRKKAEILNRDRLVELGESTLSFDDVAGLDGFKDFVRRILRRNPLDAFEPDARYKGVVAVGPPGTGKTLMAYCVGNEFNMPTLLINPGNLMQSYVGDTERNTRKMFAIVRRMAPCIAVIDEVGQVMPSGDDDSSGVSKRMLGTFLSAMSDIKEPVFWFFTSNDIESMHEAFFRAERVDAAFYVRPPTAVQRAAAWKIYLKKFFPAEIDGAENPRYIGADVEGLIASVNRLKKADWQACATRIATALLTRPPADREALVDTIVNEKIDGIVPELIVDDEGWTPAEIRACCRLALRLGLPVHEAARMVGHKCLGPRGERMLTRLDRWAVNEGALDAETGRLFAPEAATVAKPKAKGGDAIASRKVGRRVTNLKD